MSQQPTSPTDRPGRRRGEANSRRTMRAVWTPPALEALPRLTELTLQTGDAIGGGGDTGGGGSTVF